MHDNMTIAVLTAAEAERHMPRLVEMLTASVEDGALVGFVLPFSADQAQACWHGAIRSVSDGERLLVCALIAGQVVGTVQLYLSPEPNAPHRAEVYKLLVHRDFQRRGLGAALMDRVEAEAGRRNRSLLPRHRPGRHRRLYHASSHRGRHFQRLVNADEIAPNAIERDHVDVVLELL